MASQLFSGLNLIKYPKIKYCLMLALMACCIVPAKAQTMDKMWDDRYSGKDSSNIQWFRDAKFGLFIHWGLYSKLAGEWNSKRYYGSGEWIMNQAKISASVYAKIAKDFNPVKFNAEEWSQLASKPLHFIKHAISICNIRKSGNYKVQIRPLQNGKELFKLKSVILEASE